MYGAISSMVLNAVGGPYVPVDGDALVHADFVAEVYEVGGAPSSLAAMFSGTDPTGFSASGMTVGYDSANRPMLAGAAFAAIAEGLSDGITLLFELDGLPGDTILFVGDHDEIGEETEYLWLTSQPGAENRTTLSFGSNTLPTNDFGINRIAFSFSRDLGGGTWRHALSVNGSTVSTSGDHYQEVAYSIGAYLEHVGTIEIGGSQSWGYTNDNEAFRKFIAYPAMDDAALSALTAL